MTHSYYLGAAIDLSSTLNPFDIMSEKVTTYDPKCVIFRPDRAYNNAHNSATINAHYLKSVNDHALLSADVAIFYISSKVFSMGAALEIQERARMHGNGMGIGRLSMGIRVDNGKLYEAEPIPEKKTIVITDKAGLYLKIQHSKDLHIHIIDKPLEEINIAELIESAYNPERKE